MDKLDELTHSLFPNYKPTGDEALDAAVWAKMRATVADCLPDVEERMAAELDGNMARQTMSEYKP